MRVRYGSSYMFKFYDENLPEQALVITSDETFYYAVNEEEGINFCRFFLEDCIVRSTLYPVNFDIYIYKLL
jgi:hypothetical protein